MDGFFFPSKLALKRLLIHLSCLFIEHIMTSDVPQETRSFRRKEFISRSDHVHALYTLVANFLPSQRADNCSVDF